MLTSNTLPDFAGLEFIAGTWWNVYTDGTRLPLIAGGAEDDDADTDKADDDASDDDADTDDDKDRDKLGDPGKKALDRMKEQRNAARDQLREFKALGLTAKEIEERLGKGKPKSKAKADDDDDADKVDPDQIREEARREARAQANLERAVDKIEARAGRTFDVDVVEDGKSKTVKLRFNDPEDAAAFLRDKAKDFVDGDTIDTEAIDEALAELLAKKPHLAAATDGKRKFDGDADAGARKTGDKKPTSLNDAIGRKYAGNKS